MLFNLPEPIPQPLAKSIIRSILAVDNSAQVRVDRRTREIRVVGQLTRRQAAAALGQAGCDERKAGKPCTDHEQGGSTCCGSCQK